MRLILLIAVTSWTAFAADLDSGNAKAVEKWISERAKQASAGQAEIVRFPLAHHGSWGSSYPTYYVGTQLESAPGDALCLSPKWAKGAEEPDTLEVRHSAHTSRRPSKPVKARRRLTHRAHMSRRRPNRRTSTAPSPRLRRRRSVAPSRARRCSCCPHRECCTRPAACCAPPRPRQRRCATRARR